MTDSREQFEQMIREDLGDSPESSICLSVLEYLVDNSHRNVDYITFAGIKKVAGKSIFDDEILHAVQYLCGERLGLLETRYELSDGNDLTKDQVKSAQQTGILTHPVSGYEIDNFMDKIFMYFVPSSKVKNMTT